jgi:hypothetical protein
MDRPEVACKDPAVEIRQEKQKEQAGAGEYNIDFSIYISTRCHQVLTNQSLKIETYL